MTSLRSRLSVLATAALLLAPGLSARSYDASDPYSRQRSEIERGEFSYDDSQDVPWREQGADKLEVPAPPEDAALAQLQLDTLQRPFTAHLDTRTLAVSPVDGVVRYWLVVRSGGSATISYEGMNCQSREYKIYAFADPRQPGGLRRVPEPKWQPLGLGRRNDFRWELADTYLCIGKSAKAPQDVIGTIRGYYQRQNPMSEYTDNTRPQLP
jgi:hypothetical protein